MYAMRRNGEYTIKLQKGDMDSLEKGTELSRELIDKARPGQTVSVSLGTTKHPNIDISYLPEGSNFENAKQVKIVINNDYGYEFLKRGDMFGVLCGSDVRVVNRYWESNE
jgi:secreted protein with Ig-like and vWFA domain